MPISGDRPGNRGKPETLWILTGLARAQVDNNQALVGYTIDARLNPDQKTITASARVRIRTDMFFAPDEIRLHLRSAGNWDDGAMKMEIVTLRTADGATPETEKVQDEPYLTVLLPDSEDGANLQVEYTVPIDPADTTNIGYYYYAGIGPGNDWYPDVIGSNGELPRFADFDVTLEYPSDWAVLTSGHVVEDTESADLIRRRFMAEHLEGFGVRGDAGLCASDD